MVVEVLIVYVEVSANVVISFKCSLFVLSMCGGVVVIEVLTVCVERKWRCRSQFKCSLFVLSMC